MLYLVEDFKGVMHVIHDFCMTSKAKFVDPAISGLSRLGTVTLDDTYQVRCHVCKEWIKQEGVSDSKNALLEGLKREFS